MAENNLEPNTTAKLPATQAAPAITSQALQIPGKVTLLGDLQLPANPTGLVIFAHGSGSSRKSPRNRQVASLLNKKGLATLLVDLLTPGEEAVDVVTREYRFNINMLAERLVDISKWLQTNAQTKNLPMGYFGASTGAAAALIAAADLPNLVKAVVSRGGRPDLAGERLRKVKAPTLLLVGSLDEEVITLNHEALFLIGSDVKQLEIIAGATHLFEEPGTLRQVSEEAADWFLKYLP
jgi:pimeloyl-ACP methyl ester carboxylesterase